MKNLFFIILFTSIFSGQSFSKEINISASGVCSNTPDTVKWGDLICLRWLVDADTSFTHHWYFSTDTIWDGNDQFMASHNQRSLNSSNAVNYRVNCSEGTFGRKYILHVIDPLNKVVEGNENDNFYYDSIYVAYSANCGIKQSLSAGSNISAPFFEVYFASHDITNHFPVASTIDGLVYCLSKDYTYDEGDIRLNVQDFSLPFNLDAGQSYSSSNMTLNYFNTIPDGTYNLGVFVLGAYQGELNGVETFTTFSSNQYQFGSITSANEIVSSEPDLISTINVLGQEVNERETGFVIEKYSDGTVRKIFRSEK
jgi:hypothetical protein